LISKRINYILGCQSSKAVSGVDSAIKEKIMEWRKFLKTQQILIKVQKEVAFHGEN